MLPFKPSIRSTDNRRQLWISIAILVLMLAVGAGGFYLLGTDLTIFQSVYLTSLILTTVGMKENDVTLNSAQQAWALIVMLVGISAALYAAGNLVAFIIDGELRRIFGKRQLQNKIGRLKDHFIVCGFGRMGRALCEELNKQGAQFVLIEHNMQRTQEAERLGYLHLDGDAMSEEVLMEARVDHARGLASCLRDDADNVFVTLTVRGINEKITLISRAEEIGSESKLRRAGADRVICTPLLGATRITHMLLRPGIDDLLELSVAGPNLEISKVSLNQMPNAVGRSLRDLSLPSEAGLMVVALVHGDGNRTFNPPLDAKLRPDDEMIVISPSGGVDKMMQKLGKSPD